MASANLSLGAALVATGVPSGSAKNIKVPEGRELIPVQIRGITTATVAIQGSIDGTNYTTIVSKTADFAGLVEAFPYMRANVTAWTTGTIYVGLWADQVFAG